jgi:hypothetical protein
VALKNWNTTPNCLRKTSALATAVPLTIAGWGITNSTTAGVMACIVQSSGSGANRFQLQTNGNPSNIAANAIAAGTGSLATTTTSTATGVWFHACAVFSANNARAAYLNGGGKGTNATTRTPTSLNQTAIGLADDTQENGQWQGSLADVAFWNVALSDWEIFLLAQGVDPRTIRPGNLLAYLPCNSMGGQEIDLGGRANNFAVIGTLQPADDAVLMDITFDREWFEHTGGKFTTVALDGAMPFELRSTVRNDGALTAELLTKLQADAGDLPLELLRVLAIDGAAPLELLTTSRNDGSAPLELLRAVLNDGPLPLELLGGVTVTLDGAAPIELLGGVRVDFATPLESLRLVPADSPAALEFLSGLAADAVAPLELIGTGIVARLYGVTAGPNLSTERGAVHLKAKGVGVAGQENIPQDDPVLFPTSF